MVKFAAQGSQACLYIAKAIPVSQLGKGHRQVLVPTREASWPRISAVTSNATAELTIRQETHQLGEYGLALIHASLSPTPESAVGAQSPFKSRQA